MLPPVLEMLSVISEVGRDRSIKIVVLRRFTAK